MRGFIDSPSFLEVRLILEWSTGSPTPLLDVVPARIWPAIDTELLNLKHPGTPSRREDGSNRHEIVVARRAARKARAGHPTAQSGPDLRRDCDANRLEPHRRVRHLQTPRRGWCEGLARRAQRAQERRRPAAGCGAGGRGAQAHRGQDAGSAQDGLRAVDAGGRSRSSSSSALVFACRYARWGCTWRAGASRRKSR